MNIRDPVSTIPHIGPAYIKKLEKLEINTVGDLLLHVPHRYLDYRIKSDIDKLQAGEVVTVTGEITDVKNTYTRSRKNFQTILIKDMTGDLTVVFFNQPYLVRSLREGQSIALAGEVGTFNHKIALISPEFEILSETPTLHTGRLVPVYPATAGISSKWLRSRIRQTYESVKDTIDDYLDIKLRQKLDFPEIGKAIEMVHFPQDPEEAKLGKKRLAFDELFKLQISSLYRKISWQNNTASHQLTINKDTQQFFQTLPFKLTQSQTRSITEIFNDLQKPVPMNRLLEGDVGSGKTVVAAAAAFAAFLNGYQTVLMAPTQILAQQHYRTLQQLLSKYKVRVSLITSSGIESDPGKTDIYIGTHALIHREVDFQSVALVIIDEQHRFGVEQRAHLISKSREGLIAPHVLTMTATPIPRTIALTVYGDLDLSTLDELPEGRLPITTWIVPPIKREGAYQWIKDQINKDHIQVYLICPLIEESENESMKQIKTATEEYHALKKVFPEFKLGLLHGKLKSQEKNSILDEFKDGKINILVSTPVVEVGIDVANATIMLIEGAERFGLSQLHQLRGRVGRGEKKSYCLLITESRSPTVYTRLQAMTKTKSGFELSELDLKLRGPGEIYGLRQHGFQDLKIASWQDTQLIRQAKQTAGIVLKDNKLRSKMTRFLNLSVNNN